ncbi:RICIN domain-containing protein [Actinomadura sp. 6N118]|uniref:RICIN domain-containing protein n=1 Tax=Actinomadura sp. 6N118 TaxID=3375151 RepID=UPI00379FF455
MRHVIKSLPGGRAGKSAAIGMAVLAAATFSPVAWSDAVAQTPPAPIPATVGEPTTKGIKAPGVRRIMPKHVSNKCLTVHGAGGRGAKLNQYTCVGRGNQKWELVPVSAPLPTYTLRPQHRAGLCLSVPGGKYKKGVQPVVWSCNRAQDQMFWITCGGKGNTKCEIRPYSRPGRGLCLSIRGGWKSNNAPAILWRCSKAKDQKFDIR